LVEFICASVDADLLCRVQLLVLVAENAPREANCADLPQQLLVRIQNEG